MKNNYSICLVITCLPPVIPGLTRNPLLLTLALLTLTPCHPELDSGSPASIAPGRFRVKPGMTERPPQ